jgi:hypothetical protein
MRQLSKTEFRRDGKAYAHLVLFFTKLKPGVPFSTIKAEAPAWPL